MRFVNITDETTSLKIDIKEERKILSKEED